MKHIKKLSSFMLSFALVVTSLTTANFAKADAKTITVTIDVEDFSKSLVPPTDITLSEDELAKLAPSLANAGCSYEDTTNLPMTPAFILQKAVDSKLLEKVSYTGGNPGFISGSDEAANAYWSYRINNETPVDPTSGWGLNFCNATLKDGDHVTVFRQTMYCATAEGEEETYPYGHYTKYGFFDKAEYNVTANQKFNVTLKSDKGDAFSTDIIPAANAKIELVGVNQNTTLGTTNASGVATISIADPGVYLIKSDAGSERSRSYAIVNVGTEKNTEKKAQTVTCKPASKTVKAKSLKKKAKKITLKAKSTAGNVKFTYTVAKGSKKYIKVSKSGVVTLKKKCKKGTYKIKIIAAETSLYTRGSVVVTIKVK